MHWPPVIVLDPASPAAPYEQLRSQLIAWIAAHRLEPGAQLPSVRQLARDLNLAPNTVVRAYDELQQSGWIVATPRKGFVVAAIPPAMVEEERQRRLRNAVAHLVAVVRQWQVDPLVAHTELDQQLHAGKGQAQ